MFIIKTVVDAMVTILQRNQAGKELFIAAVMGHLEVVLFLWIAGAGKNSPALVGSDTVDVDVTAAKHTACATAHKRTM